MDNPQPVTANRKKYHTLIIAGVVTGFVFIPLASYLISPHIATGLPRLYVSRLVTWADIVLLYYYARKVEHRQFLIWTENWYDPSFYIKWLFLLFLLIICCGIIARIPELFGFHDNQAITLKLMALVKSTKIGFVFTLITAGVTEELIMRGYILPRLELVIKTPYLPLIITSLLFSALHYGYHSLGELIFTFCFAIVFGWFYQKYRSIITLIMLHTLIDLIALNIHHTK